MKRLLVFADGSEKGGASGVHEMLEYSEVNPCMFNVKICGVISPYPNGGAHKHATEHGVPFECWKGPYDAEGYQSLVKKYRADYVMGSGHLKMFRGLNPRTTTNIHPALTPADGTHGRFGGKGMHGHYVHEAVWEAFQRGEITQTGVTIHFATEEYDTGPVIWQMPVLIRKDDTPDTIGNRVNQVERAWQSHVINLVVNGLVYLDDETGNWKVVASNLLCGFPGLCPDKWRNIALFVDDPEHH